MSSRAGRLAACAAVGLLLAVPSRAQILAPDYEGALRQYARGDRAGALAALGRMRPGDLDDQVKRLQQAAKDAARCPMCKDWLDGIPLTAAVMLHADRDQAERPLADGTEQQRACPGDHARRAGQIASLLARREHEREREFARRFFLAMAQGSQWDFCLDSAVQWGRDGLARFPRDPDLLLGLGAALEEEGTLWIVTIGGMALAPNSKELEERSHRFFDARSALLDQVAAAPGTVEGRIRLGRVQWRLGQYEAARQTLEEAVRLGGAPALQYMAHLFLGQVHDRTGRTDDAVTQYTLALELQPESQAAAVGLSHALLARGDAERARAVLEEALSHAGRREARDPFWDYVASNAAQAPALFETLRAETRE